MVSERSESNPALQLLLLLTALGGASCASADDAAQERLPAVWHLVEAGVPGGTELVLEREGPVLVDADGRIGVRLSRRRAAAGELVEAELWVREPSGIRELRIRPARPGVRLQGPATFVVEGSAPVRIRFTCAAPGSGGIEVRVRE